jgi:hypothetical protein
MGHTHCAGGRPIANAAGAACSGFAVLLSYYPGYSYPYPGYSYRYPGYSYPYPAYPYRYPGYSYPYPAYPYRYPGYSYPYPVEHLPCGQDVGAKGLGDGRELGAQDARKGDASGTRRVL